MQPAAKGLPLAPSSTSGPGGLEPWHRDQGLEGSPPGGSPNPRWVPPGRFCGVWPAACLRRGWEIWEKTTVGLQRWLTGLQQWQRSLDAQLGCIVLLFLFVSAYAQTAGAGQEVLLGAVQSTRMRRTSGDGRVAPMGLRECSSAGARCP